jgi:transcriptional regulator with XRE-family HTH domain
MDNVRILFGKRVRELRTKLDISQERLGVMAGIDIASVERGETAIRLTSIVRIAQALRVPPWELLSKFPPVRSKIK